MQEETRGPGSIKVSVVLPVYNTEAHLPQCMDSIVGQTLREIEIICINDGSTDRSGEILNEYAQRDSRVSVITQNNRGPGASRNAGMARARGQYLIFWDSDDDFDRKTLEHLYTRAEQTNADLCICNARDFDDVTGAKIAHNYLRKPYPETETFCMADCMERIFDFTPGVCWNKLVRRDFMRETNILFPEGDMIEDQVVSMLQLSLAKRIAVCDKRLIHYRVNRGESLLGSYGKHPDAAINGFGECYRQMSQRGLLEDPAVRRSFFDKIAGLYLYYLRFYGDFDQYCEYYEKTVLQDGALFFLWDAQWEPMPNTQKYLQARAQSPGEYLFHQFRELKFSDMRQKALIQEWKTKSRKKDAELQKIREELAAQNVQIAALNEQFAVRNAESQQEKALLAAQMAALNAQLADGEQSLRKREEEIRSLSAANRALRRSLSYRIGRAVTWVPRKLRQFGKTLRGSGAPR